MLSELRPYWDFNAFTQRPGHLTWALSKIAHLNEAQLWALDNDVEQQAHYFAGNFPTLFEWQAQCEPAPVTTQLPSIPFWLHTDIPGRKWQQIQGFCAATTQNAHANSSASAIEWCAGKGHLGRLHTWLCAQPVISIEWQNSLCLQGQQYANKLKLPQLFINADIHQLPLSATTAQGTIQCATQAPHWMALHACGELHCHFLHTATQHKASTIALAPCCYHRQQATHYQALCTAAQATALPASLNLQALRLAQQNQITAGNREREQRANELNWRLGYEALRQTLQPGTPYKNLPSKQKQSHDNFEQFCQWAAPKHQVNLPATIDWPAFEAQGQQERLQMMRHDAIRHCFRRPLELWLALDKAVFLEEQGYSVSLQQFCANHISPRNLLLLANRDINAANSPLSKP